MVLIDSRNNIGDRLKGRDKIKYCPRRDYWFNTCHGQEYEERRQYHNYTLDTHVLLHDIIFAIIARATLKTVFRRVAGTLLGRNVDCKSHCKPSPLWNTSTKYITRAENEKSVLLLQIFLTGFFNRQMSHQSNKVVRTTSWRQRTQSSVQLSPSQFSKVES